MCDSDRALSASQSDQEKLGDPNITNKIKLQFGITFN